MATQHEDGTVSLNVAELTEKELDAIPDDAELSMTAGELKERDKFIGRGGMAAGVFVGVLVGVVGSALMFRSAHRYAVREGYR